MDDLIARFGSWSLSSGEPAREIQDLIVASASLSISNDESTQRNPIAKSDSTTPALESKVQKPAQAYKVPAQAKQEISSTSPTFPFETSISQKSEFLPRLDLKTEKYMQIYEEAEKIVRIPTSKPHVKSPEFAIANLKSNILNYKKFCIAQNKLVVEPIITSQNLAITTALPDPKYNFISLASKKVAKKIAHRDAARKVKTKLNLLPRDVNATVIEIRKIADAAELAGGDGVTYCSREIRTKAMLQRSLGRYFRSKTKSLSRPSKRKFPSQHHIVGSVLIEKEEFTLLERKVCGAHKSKKLRDGRGLAPRKRSKQLVFDILSNPHRALSMFSDFLSPQIYGKDFMKSIPRTLTRFMLFSKLPVELQQSIWEYALPDHRICVSRIPGFKHGFEPISGLSHVEHYILRCNFALLGHLPCGSMENYLDARVEHLKKAQIRLDRGLSTIERERQLLTAFPQKNRNQWATHHIVWESCANSMNDCWYMPGRVAPFDAVSALLQTCKSSRDQVLLTYEPAFERRDGIRKYYNFQRDAIYPIETPYFHPQGRFRTDGILTPKRCLLGSERLKKDVGKIRHLVIGNFTLRDDELSEYLAEHLPDRLTVDMTETFISGCPMFWDIHTAICDSQRFMGDAWFVHLPLSRNIEPHNPRLSCTSLQEELGALREKYPGWQPVIEHREIARRDFDWREFLEVEFSHRSNVYVVLRDYSDTDIWFNEWKNRED